MWKVLRVAFRFTTDGNAATRSVYLLSRSGLIDDHGIQRSSTQAASLTVDYFYGFTGSTDTTVDGRQMMSLPSPWFIFGAGTIITSTASIQTGDQFSRVVLYVEEWNI